MLNFQKRTETRGVQVASPKLKAHGCDWEIDVYPRGDSKSSTKIEYISCFLKYISSKSDKHVRFTLRIGDNQKTGSQKFVKNSQVWGWSTFERKHILENCLAKDGSLVIECDIQIGTPWRIWNPQKLERNEALVELYHKSYESYDVEFSVQSGTFRAHKSILFLKCKKLYEIAKESGNKEIPVAISSTGVYAFKCILEFIYTVKEPELKTMFRAIELLEAADRFECVDLKLYVESVIINRFLTTSNAAKLLVLADSHSCPLLKEAAINVIVKDANGLSKIRESSQMLKELLNSLSTLHESKGNEIDQMDLATLLGRLQEAELQKHGSRDSIVDRWKKTLSKWRNKTPKTSY